MLAHAYFAWWAAQIVAVGFLVFLFLRWRPGFMGGRTVGETVGRSLDTRENQIREQLEAAQTSRDEADRINQQSERDIAQARQESEGIVTRASETSTAIQEDIQARAREEYDRIVGQARAQIEYEREQAEMALRRRAADIVVDAAGQIVEQYLQPQTDRKIIEDSFEHLRKIQ